MCLAVMLDILPLYVRKINDSLCELDVYIQFGWIAKFLTYL